jgi:hypothetical protein
MPSPDAGEGIDGYPVAIGCHRGALDPGQRGRQCAGDTSGPGTQRSQAAASTTSRLSHPMSPRLPRLAARPREALLLLHVLLQFPTRKRPSPCRERALTCGN